MSKRGEERALEAYPEHWKFNKNATGTYDRNFQRRKSFIDGYEQAEKDTIERAIIWWYDHLVKNFSDGVVAAICDEFRKYMEEEQ